MPPKLIYLHIPKTGGSSQRFNLYDLYRRENVFWFGIDDKGGPLEAFNAERLATYAVIGGHRPIGFYPPALDALYFGVIRDPVARVCSLFTHIAKPRLKETAGDRDRKHAIWLERGIDPASIVNSLSRCEEFRRQASNDQCRYLSRGSPDFEGACATLRQLSCAIGISEAQEVLNRRLGEMLHWIEMPEKRLNRSPDDHMVQVLREPGAREAIEELNCEDIRLYHHVRDVHAGLLVNIPDPVHFSGSLSSTQYPPAFSALELGLRYLSLYSKGYTGIRADGTATVSLVISNSGKLDVDFSGFPGLGLRCEVFDPEGRLLHSERVPCQPGSGVAAGGYLPTTVEVIIPRDCRERAAYLRVELALDPSRVLSALNPLHPAVLHLFRLGEEG